MRAAGLHASLLVALLAAPAVAAGQGRAPSREGADGACAGRPAPDETLRRELLRMLADDQAARDRWIAAKYSEAEGREMHALDLKHAARLRAIFREQGFPGVCLAGRDGASAARTLLLHTTSLELQKEALPHLEAAAGRGEIPRASVAELTDDILGAEGKPQLYGTNFELKDGRLVLKPVSDPDRLEERRARMGLPPMSVYVKVLEEIYRTSAAPSPLLSPTPSSSPSPTPTRTPPPAPPAGRKP
jgi:hypothetical protein